MSTSLTEDIVEEFLKTNNEFVEKWLSANGLEEIAEDSSKYLTASNIVSNFFKTLLHRDEEQDGAFLIVSQIDLFNEILRLVTSEIDINTLTHKMLQNACILLHCDRTTLFLVQGNGNKKYLISRLCDVTNTSEMNETLFTEENTIYIPFGKGICGWVAENKCLLNVKDAYHDPHFLKDIDERTGFKTEGTISIPIFDKNGHLIGVTEASNKLEGKQFDSRDVNIFEYFSKFCTIGINNANLYKASQEENKRHKMILKLIKCILKDGTDIQKLVSEILQQAMEILECDNISAHLIDKKNYSPTKSTNVFQLLRGDTKVKTTPIDPRFIPVIEQHMNSGSMVNVISLSNSYGETKVTLEGDIRNWMICILITDRYDNLIGYMMFLKETIATFSGNNINMMKTFAKFCGLAIYNSQLYKSCYSIMSRSSISDEMLVVHTTCKEKNVYRMQQLEIQSSDYYKIYRFEFVSNLCTENETVLLTVLIFLEMNVLELLNTSKDTLYRWILTVKRNYRPVTYHNWRHAVNVVQTMFCMLTTGKLQKYFTEFEQVCLLMSCLCHDLDHRGTNNAFQVNTASPLATLYSTSILENHHLDRSIKILDNDDTNIFQNITAEKYQYGLKLMEKAIIATDLVVYFERRNIFKSEIESGHNTFESQESIYLLITMMMTAADLSAIAKPWEVHRKTAMLIADEFFEQGDLERDAEIVVLPLMDRRKRYEIPKMQLGFFDFVGSLVYKLLSQLQGLLTPLYHEMLNNRAHWSDIANGKEEFDVDKEYEIALKMFHSDEPGENVIPLKDVVPCVIFPTSFVNAATQTPPIYSDPEQEQQMIQTILSYPFDASVTVSDLTTPVLLGSDLIFTQTKKCQTEIMFLDLKEAFVQTDVPATRTGEELPAQPIQYRQQSVSAKSNYSGSETKFSSILKSPCVAPRRSSCFDELVYERRQELERKKKKLWNPKTYKEKPLSIKRLSRIILPPNPVREISTSHSPSSDLVVGNNSNTAQTSMAISEIKSDEILFEGVSKKSSSKSEMSNSTYGMIEDKPLEKINEESVSNKSPDVTAKSSRSDSNSTENDESRQMACVASKRKLSWSSIYNKEDSNSRVTSAKSSLSTHRSRRGSEVRRNSTSPRRLSDATEFRKRKCVKTVPKNVQKNKKMHIWNNSACVIS